MQTVNVSSCLPEDFADAVLIGRVWRPAPVNGPAVVAVRKGEVFDITRAAPTTADLFDHADALDIARNAEGEHLGNVQDLLQATLDASAGGLRLLAPCDVQAVKACGVTFAVSLLERVIEEQAGGDASRAQEVRDTINKLIGADLSKIEPGSDAAMKLKAELERRGAWSQYMEVGIGPDAEVFSKSQPMSSVGFGADVGLYPTSKWNNPEPEIVLAVNARGEIVGATLGNDGICAISKAAARCCWARRRTTTRRARSARSCVFSTSASRWIRCARRACRCASKARTMASCSKA